MNKIQILRRRLFLVAIVVCMFLYNTLFVVAQNGSISGGIDKANTEIKQLFDPVSKLIMAIGAIVGLIGGIRCYIKWNNGDQDVMKAIMGWGGACIFLVMVSIVIKGFFGA